MNKSVIKHRVYYLKLKYIDNPFLENKIKNNILTFFRKILSKDDFSKIAFGDEDLNKEESLFLFTNTNISNLIIDYFFQKNLLKEYKDITEDILMSNYINDDFINVFSSDEYSKLIDTYRLKNLDTDGILDKILLNGLSSLNDIDYKILDSEIYISESNIIYNKTKRINLF